jgi:methylmalonyl-CoA mutase
MLYEHKKHDGSLPIIGVNTFLNPHQSGEVQTVELARASEEEKRSQVERLAAFQEKHRVEAEPALARLKEAAASGSNTFSSLMDAVRVCSMGQITSAFFEVGGQYRRNV